MNTRAKNSGIVIAVCAIGIMIVKYLTNEGFDSYVLPFILLCISGTLFFRKPKKESKQIQVSKKQQNIILSIASIALVTGLVSFVITFL